MFDNSKMDSYLRQVDRSFSGFSGVRFATLAPLLATTGRVPAIEDSMRKRENPTDYATALINLFGFKVDDPKKKLINEGAAKLLQIAAEDPKWKVGNDGCIYRETAGGVMKVIPKAGTNHLFRPDVDFEVQHWRNADMKFDNATGTPTFSGGDMYGFQGRLYGKDVEKNISLELSIWDSPQVAFRGIPQEIWVDDEPEFEGEYSGPRGP